MRKNISEIKFRKNFFSQKCLHKCLYIRSYLRIVHPNLFHQTFSNGRISTITSKNQVTATFNIALFFIFKSQISFIKISAHKLRIEMIIHIGIFIDQTDQVFVQSSAVNREDVLMLLAVGLACFRTIVCVDHTSVHWYTCEENVEKYIKKKSIKLQNIRSQSNIRFVLSNVNTLIEGVKLSNPGKSPIVY